MTFIKKNIFFILLFFYFIIGAFYSLNTGLSFDEIQEQRNWEYNVSLVKHLLFQSEIELKYQK